MFKFYEQIQKLCIDNQVKLIVVSNSNIIIEAMENRLCLSDKIPGPQVLESEILSSLGHNQRKLILVDGPDDKLFLEKYATELRSAEIMERKIMNFSNKNYKLLHELIMTSSNNLIVHIRDPEFMPPDLIPPPNEKKKPLVIYWNLPCIESFLILHYFLNGLPVPEKPKGQNQSSRSLDEQLHDYFDEGKTRWTHYIAGVGDAISELKEEKEITLPKQYIPNLYDLAVAETKKSHDQRDYLKIVRVIRGHTFVKEVTNNETTDLISQAPDFSGLHPDVQEMLKQVFEKSVAYCELK